MSTINDRINAFISKYDLNDTQEFRDGLGDFVAGCWEDHFKICMNETIPAKASKVTKSEKIEDPTECKEINDLRNCTSAILDEYCKTHGLRVGGTKKEKMDRVWRHLQGNNSEDDISPRGKPKKEKKVNEKHSCYGCTSKGTPCAAAATVEVDDHWFCWRHEESAAEIIASKAAPVAKESEKATGGAKKAKVVEKKVEEKVVKKKKVTKKPEPEPEPESEPESEEEEELVETDEE
jgi:hypothetical protein